MTKTVADILTLSRFFLAATITVLGFSLRQQALPVIFVLLLTGWTTDALDGPLARMAQQPRHTWLGDNEALADAALAVGALIAFGFCGYISLLAVAIYLLVAGAVVVPTRSLSWNMAFTSLIHAFTLYAAFRYGGLWGWLVVLWIVITLILDWRRFTNLVQLFFHGFARPSAQEDRGAEGSNGSQAFLRH